MTPLPELRGPFRFADWPVEHVPKVAAGVYAIWDDQALAYIGMSGRGRSAVQLREARRSGRRLGLWTRLDSHASGRRSGDQFCVYVSDRLVLPTLGQEEIAGIGRGEVRFDELVRARIRDHMTFGFAITTDGREAQELERELRAGLLGEKPLLNPL